MHTRVIAQMILAELSYFIVIQRRRQKNTFTRYHKLGEVNICNAELSEASVFKREECLVYQDLCLIKIMMILSSSLRTIHHQCIHDTDTTEHIIITRRQCGT